MSFGKEFEKRRLKTNLSLEQVSKATNIPVKRLKSFEKNDIRIGFTPEGLIVMTPEELWWISNVLNWPISDILETDEFKRLKERKNHG